MRVSQGMISDNNLRHLSSSYSKLNTYMEQLNTGKKVSKPSDDPVVVMKGMNYRSEVNRINQYKRNTGEVHNWMDNTDSALDKTTQALQKLRELAVQASNDSYSEKERENIMEEAKQLKEHLIDIANTKVNDKYIFNGSNTSERHIKPGEDGELEINFATSEVRIEVAAGTELKANVNPEDVFGSGDDNNVFNAIDKLIKTLDEDNQADISASIEDLDHHIDNVINTRADLGARMNRLELIE